MAIRRMRERRNVTQAQLASTAGLGQPTISRIETGITSRPEPASKERIIEALNRLPVSSQETLFETT